jgi:hypothetical protein
MNGAQLQAIRLEFAKLGRQHVLRDAGNGPGRLTEAM